MYWAGRIVFQEISRARKTLEGSVGWTVVIGYVRTGGTPGSVTTLCRFLVFCCRAKGSLPTPKDRSARVTSRWGLAGIDSLKSGSYRGALSAQSWNYTALRTFAVPTYHKEKLMETDETRRAAQPDPLSAPNYVICYTLMRPLFLSGNPGRRMATGTTGGGGVRVPCRASYGPHTPPRNTDGVSKFRPPRVPDCLIAPPREEGLFRAAVTALRTRAYPHTRKAGVFSSPVHPHTHLTARYSCGSIHVRSGDADLKPRTLQNSLPGRPL